MVSGRFCPCQNPDMWSQHLFNAMARLARPGLPLPPSPRRALSAVGCRRRALPCRRPKALAASATCWSAGWSRRWRSPLRRPGLRAAPAHRATWRSLAAGSPAPCSRSPFSSVAGRSRSTALTRRPPAARPATVRGALSALCAHDPALFQFFPAAFTFARRLYDALPVTFDHDWCGVTQLGWDEKSQQKIAQMLSLGLPKELARAVRAQEVADTAGVETGCGGIQYPLGGWLCPAELTAAVIAPRSRAG